MTEIDIRDLRSLDRYVSSEVISGMYGNTPITLVNLSAVGAQIEHAAPIRLGTKSRLRFTHRGVSAAAQGLTIWSRLSKTPDKNGKYLYHSGIRVEDESSDFGAALGQLFVAGVMTPDEESLQRKKERQLEREKEKARAHAPAQPRPAAELSVDQALLVQHARNRLSSNPQEAQRWYNRARLRVAKSETPVGFDPALHKEEVLAVWEYLEGTVDIQTIAAVLEAMRNPRT